MSRLRIGANDGSPRQGLLPDPADGGKGGPLHPRHVEVEPHRADTCATAGARGCIERARKEVRREH